MLPRGLFVTGTDTGVGKTVVAAAMALALRARGHRVGVMKPAESGCPRTDGRLLAPDAAFLLEAAGCSAAMETVNPYALAAPLAPALAAELEGVLIDIERIRACYRQLAAEHDVVLVEGAGGLLTPLSGQLTMRDLAVELALPAVVVVRNALGAINHAALTVEAARHAALPVVGLVLNHPSPELDPAARTNADALRRWGGAPLIGELPYALRLDRTLLGSFGETLISTSEVAFLRTGSLLPVLQPEPAL